jgi:hypothetical protein
MKSYQLLIAGVVVVTFVALISLAFFFIRGTSSTTSQTPFQTSTSTSGFPIVNDPGTTSSWSGSQTGTQNGATVQVPLSNGTKIVTQDFVHNGTTFQDPSNAGTYYVAGSSGVCNPDGSCPHAGTATNYTIQYYANDGSFNIALADEPLGEVRKAAEQNLMKSLGITQEQMCYLNYSVITSTYVSQKYGGINLGFSFCPGATQLP